MARSKQEITPVQPFYPGRYAAIDVGSYSVQMLVADIDEDGVLNQVADCARTTRLAERFHLGNRLVRSARERTLEAVSELDCIARQLKSDCIAVVGTSVLRDAANTRELSALLRRECGLPIEVITGEQEADLTYQGNLYDRRLPGIDGERVVLNIGCASTELVRGIGETITNRASYKLGAFRLTEAFLKSDPVTSAECATVEMEIEQALYELEPLSTASALVGSGGTVVTLASVARSAGMISQSDVHGSVLTHARVTELVELLRSLPVQFRKRLAGLSADRAGVIFAGALILHQVMARLSASNLIISSNGVRHGCIYAIARRALIQR